MRHAIERGEFDAEIAGAFNGTANVSGIADVAVPPVRKGDPEQVREQQQAETMRQDGRNPDGSLIGVFGERS